MKTVGEFIAEWKIYGDDKEFVAALDASLYLNTINDERYERPALLM